MADISKIILPSGSEYYFKDEYIREIVQNNHVSKTGEGNVVAVEDLAEGVPFQNLSVDFSPKQDLRGMEHPYPAGSTTNLIPDGTDEDNGYVYEGYGRWLKSDGTIQNNSSTDRPNYISEYFPVTGGATYTLSQSPALGNESAICFYDSSKTFISGVAYNQQASQTFAIPANAAYARATQPVWDKASHGARYIAQFELGSTATTIHHYSNICPPSGRESIDIFVRGKNLLITTSEHYRTTHQARSTLLDDGSIEITTSVNCGFVCPVKPNTTYTASYDKNGWATYLYVFEYDREPSKTTIATSARTFSYVGRTVSLSLSSSKLHGKATFTTSAQTKYVVVVAYRSGASVNETSTLTISNFQLEQNDDFTEYAPYANGSADYTVDLGKTAYGGTLNASTGEFTEEWAMIDSYNGEELPGEWLSDRDAYDPQGSPSIGAQVVYKLSAPVQNACEPVLITSVEGDNYIWSNEDGLSLDYNYIKDFPYYLFDLSRILWRTNGLYEPKFDILPVEKGGTGLSTLSAGKVLIGNGTNDVTLRDIVNNTSVDDCGWVSSTASTQLITVNTLAYWNGCYKNASSNIAYCKLGKIGALAIKDTTFVATTTSNGLMSAGDKSTLENLGELSTKDTTFVATQSSNGLMSAADKTKIDTLGAVYDAASETITLGLGTPALTITQNSTTGNLNIS